MIKAYFNEIDKDYNVYYIDENKPLGTGGGLSLLKGRISSTFILTNCDILVQEDFNKIYQLHKEKKHLITMVCSLKNFSVPYGVVEIGEHGEIESMREKPELSFFTNTGCYIVEPEVIEELEDDTMIGFPDIIEKYKSQAKNVGVYPIGEKAWLDMGNFEEMKRMEEILGV
jgi:NDP-sugar pyrophosphorylase family protein